MGTLLPKPLIALFFGFGILALVLVGVKITGKQAITRTLPEASGTSSGRVSLVFEPASTSVPVGKIQSIILKAKIRGGSPLEHIDYFKAEIAFPNKSIQMPRGHYINTGKSGFGKILRVDGPLQANQSGKIAIELAAKSPGDGPKTADTAGVEKEIVLATIDFVGVNPTDMATLALSGVQIINNQSKTIAATGQNGKIQVVAQ